MRGAFLVLLILLAGCTAPAAPDGHTIAGPTDLDPPDPEVRGVPDNTTLAQGAWPAISFLVIGEQGTGQDAQYRLADTLNHECDEHRCSFVVGTGGNILPLGADGPDDPRFYDNFEDPYRDMDVPFWMTIGDGDAAGGSLPERADALVQYAATPDKAVDFRMPARFYDHTEGPVEFLVLDATTLDDPAQVTWLEDRLEYAPHTPWRVAVLNTPYRTATVAGAVGDTASAVDGRTAFTENILCDRVDLVLSGGAHSLEWWPAQDGCGKTRFVISGAAAQNEPVQEGSDALFADGQLGFWSMYVDAYQIVAVAKDRNDGVLWRHTAPRSQFYPGAEPPPPGGGCGLLYTSMSDHTSSSSHPSAETTACVH